LNALATSARLVLSLAVLSLAACALGGHRRDHDEREATESYGRACASCHGVDGRGDGPVAAALRVPPADLTSLAERHGGTFPRDYVIAIITGEQNVSGHGTREMPVWSEHFGTVFGATAPAAIYARRRLELLADHVASLQRPR
jgi:mono/diheme cytochrome c family protein